MTSTMMLIYLIEHAKKHQREKQINLRRTCEGCPCMKRGITLAELAKEKEGGIK